MKERIKDWKQILREETDPFINDMVLDSEKPHVECDWEYFNKLIDEERNEK